MAQNTNFSLGGIGAPCCCTPSNTFACISGCNIPKANLTSTYANTLTGPDTTTLIYNAATPEWKSACRLNSGGTAYYTVKMTCGTNAAGTDSPRVEFRTYNNDICTIATGGHCETNGSVTLTLLDRTSITCGASFNGVWNMGNSAHCGSLFASGYTTLTITA